MRQFVLLGLRPEPEFVDVVDDLAQVVAALNPVLDLPEDLPNLVFDGVRAGGPLLESVQVGEEFQVDEVAEVVARPGLVVIDLAVFGFRSRPSLSAISDFSAN
jgi:hypothetical protein